MKHKMTLERFFAPADTVNRFKRECVRCGLRGRAEAMVESLGYWLAVVTARTLGGGKDLFTARQQIEKDWLNSDRIIVRPFAITYEMAEQLIGARNSQHLTQGAALLEAMAVWSAAMAKIDLATLRDNRLTIEESKEAKQKDREKVLRLGSRARNEMRQDLAYLKRDKKLKEKLLAKRDWI